MGTGSNLPKGQGCPYGGPPEIEVLNEREWTINGAPVNLESTACEYLVTSPYNCEDCIFNPENGPDKSPPSKFLIHIIWLQKRIRAGAQYRHDELLPVEWDSLVLLQDEQQAAEMAKLKESHARL